MGGGGGNHYLDSNASRDSSTNISSLRGVTNAEAIHKNNHTNSSISSEKSGLRSHEQGNKTESLLTKRAASLHDLSPKDEFVPKFYFILGIIFNLCLLGFFKYTDFLLENFNAFSKLARLDFDIPLPHILLPLALSFVTFQQIAFLFDCYKRTKGELNENLYIDFIDYALFISFFPQLIAGPIVHHREMMPQFSAMGNLSLGNHCADLLDFESSQTLQSSSLPKSSKNHTSTTTNTRIVESTNPSLRGNEANEAIHNKIDCHDFDNEKSRNSEIESTRTPCNFKNSPSFAEGVRGWVESAINYEYLAKGIFIFSIGLFKKVFIADSFAKWANAGFGVVEQGGVLNIAESWATSLSYTFQLYFDFSGYCDMAMGLALMFGIVLPLNFDSPYKSLNIAEFWRRWHITLGRFLRECLYIPLGGNRVSKILNLRNLFIVAFLSGVWHGAGWGFVIWGVLHGVAMVIHRIYSWWLDSITNYNNSSLRGARSEASATKQSTNHANQHIDCHDFAMQNLAMTKKGVDSRGSIFRRFCGFSSARRGNRTDSSIDEAEREESRKSVKKTNALYKFLCWFITFNFINIAWIFFRAENLNGAVNLIKGMFGVANVEIPHKWSKIFSTLQGGTNEIIIWIVCAFIVCLALKNSFEMLKDFDMQYLRFRFSLRIFSKKIYLKGGAVWTRFVLTIALFYIAILAMLSNLLDSNAYTPFLYFNF